MKSSENIHQDVQNYYGEVLDSKEDLQTTACCLGESPSQRHQDILKKLPQEILDKFYGCGSPLPDCLEGLTVLDLGCGTGRDVYLLSKLVGENGRVIGLDMTASQLAVARKYQQDMAEEFGYVQSNVKFYQGYMENLADLGIEDNSVDLVISNCVLNLSPSKREVFQEIMRVLKPGGELYFSDVFCGQRISEELSEDPVLRGECLSGALYFEDFRRILADLGYPDCRWVSQSPLEITNSGIAEKLKGYSFFSCTVRVFKTMGLEDRAENYGLSVCYLGGLESSPDTFILDENWQFERSKETSVCRNTYQILKQGRLAGYFKFSEELTQHYGLFVKSQCGQPTKKENACCL